MKRVFLLLILSIVSVLPLAFGNNQSWESLAPGISYKKIANSIAFSSGAIHAFQIDPKTYDFEIALLANTSYIPERLKEKKAVLAINGGFFSPEMRPLGLRISHGDELSPIKATNWWGVFYIRNNKAHIVSQKNYRPHTSIEFAVQAGPRLLVDGKIPKLKPGIAYRSALGIQPSGKVVLLVTENLLLSTQELAEIMQRPEKEGGMDCIDALNLDGGRSTQLYAQLNKLSLEVPGLTKVADAILVVAKEH